MFSGGSRLQRVLVRFALVAACAMPALAQEEPPPWRDADIQWSEASVPYIQWLAGTLFIAAVAAAAFKNPHRSHLD